MKTYGEDKSKKQMAFNSLMSMDEPKVEQTADVKGFVNDYYTLAKNVKEMEDCMQCNFKLTPDMIELMKEAISKVSLIKFYVEANEIKSESGDED
jgi:hypothetical protein